MSRHGFSLIEVIVATAVFSLLVFASGQFFLATQESTQISQNKIEASALIQEYLEKIKNLRQAGWTNLTTGRYLLAVNPAGDLVLQATISGEIIGRFTRYLVLENIFQDGLIDPSRKKATVYLAWTGWHPGNYSQALTLTRYQENSLWSQTTQVEFDTGQKELVETTNTAGGEVQLQGGCVDNPQGPWIYHTGFQNNWGIHPSARSDIKEVDFTLEISSFGGSRTKLRNHSGQCTLGFSRLEFLAYNSAAITQSFWISGQWNKFVEVILPPQVWTFFSIPYADVSDTNETNLDFLFFREGTFQTGTKFSLKDLTLAGGVGGYFTQGTLISSVFDATRPVVFNRLSYTGNLPNQTQIGFQIATASDTDGPWLFTGPNGTGLDADIYLLSSGQGLRPGTNFNRYFRYKTYLTSFDGSQTPSLYDVSLNYSP